MLNIENKNLVFLKAMIGVLLLALYNPTSYVPPS